MDILDQMRADYEKQESLSRQNRDKVYRLEDMDVLKVDVVDVPANLHPFVIKKNKNARTKAMPQELLEQADGTLATMENQGAPSSVGMEAKEQMVVSEESKNAVMEKMQEVLEQISSLATWVKTVDVSESGSDKLPDDVIAKMVAASKVLFDLAKDIESPVEKQKDLLRKSEDFALASDVQSMLMADLRGIMTGLSSMIADMAKQESSEQGDDVSFAESAVAALQGFGSKINEIVNTYKSSEAEASEETTEVEEESKTQEEEPETKSPEGSQEGESQEKTLQDFHEDKMKQKEKVDYFQKFQKEPEKETQMKSEMYREAGQIWSSIFNESFKNLDSSKFSDQEKQDVMDSFVDTFKNFIPSAGTTTVAEPAAAPAAAASAAAAPVAPSAPVAEPAAPVAKSQDGPLGEFTEVLGGFKQLFSGLSQNLEQTNKTNELLQKSLDSERQSRMHLEQRVARMENMSPAGSGIPGQENADSDKVFTGVFG